MSTVPVLANVSQSIDILSRQIVSADEDAIVPHHILQWLYPLEMALTMTRLLTPGQAFLLSAIFGTEQCVFVWHERQCIVIGSFNHNHILIDSIQQFPTPFVFPDPLVPHDDLRECWTAIKRRLGRSCARNSAWWQRYVERSQSATYILSDKHANVY